MWKNIVGRGWPQKTIWRMRIACWITKATNTHAQYVILTALPLQQWLHERASLLRYTYRGADKSLARPTSRCILFDGENISFDASLVICINSTNIPPIVIINRIYENQNLLSL